MNCLQSWPEPIVRVQSLAESGITAIPDLYIKPPSKRPSLLPANCNQAEVEVNIPVIDLQNLLNQEESLRETTLRSISSACREWGFFQVVNHGRERGADEAGEGHMARVFWAAAGCEARVFEQAEYVRRVRESAGG
ncbi:hypothetical protein GBA52_019144 [Prunus armeniaca]|nr:hypothetical protein GBA52_019144 [Prunus armeniaca]